MKQNEFILTISLLFLIAIQVQSQAYNKTVISLKNSTVSPANIAQPGSGIEKINDGNCRPESEIFHTLWKGIPKQVITIEADLEGKGKRLDRVILYPRAVGLNGIIKQAELWIKSEGKYQMVATIEAEQSNTPIQIDLDKEIWNPEKIKLIVKDSYSADSGNPYMVSLGELECMMLSDDAITIPKLRKDMALFMDLTGVKLKPNIKMSDIDSMKVPALKKLATQLYNHSYHADSLMFSCHPLLNPDILGKQMRIGNGYSKFEGITGIVLEKGDNIVFVSETKGAKIKLLVPDWTRKPPAGIDPMKDPDGWELKKETFILHEGVNLVHIKKGGNVYIQYFTDTNPENVPSVTVHFPTGKLNGYFDITRGDANEYFNNLLTHSISPILDLRGKYIQVAFPVESLKKYTWGKGVELITKFDSIIYLQRKFIGWEKEGFSPANHILARVNYHYYMFRDNDGVAFIDWAMKIVADPNKVILGDPCWGFCHELGHVHQMQPQMTWGGMGEVSNNILTMFCTTSLGNKSRLSQENHYANARKTILDKNISYMDFPGKIDVNTTIYGGTGNTDVFQRLVPFWQLYLYFKEQGYNDFYPDLMIAMRKQKLLYGDNRNNQYHYMLDFCKLACEVSRTDLTEFFQRWGFFYVGDIDVYGSYLYHVSQSEVDAVKHAISNMNLPKPQKDITLMED